MFTILGIILGRVYFHQVSPLCQYNDVSGIICR